MAVESSQYIRRKKFTANILTRDSSRNLIKNCLRYMWQVNRDPLTKSHLNSSLITNFIKTILMTKKQDEWDTFIHSMDNKNGSIDKSNKCLLKKRPVIYHLTEPDDLVFSTNSETGLMTEFLKRAWICAPNLPTVATCILNINSTEVSISKMYTTLGIIKKLLYTFSKKKYI